MAALDQQRTAMREHGFLAAQRLKLGQVRRRDHCAPQQRMEACSMLAEAARKMIRAGAVPSGDKLDFTVGVIDAP